MTEAHFRHGSNTRAGNSPTSYDIRSPDLQAAAPSSLNSAWEDDQGHLKRTPRAGQAVMTKLAQWFTCLPAQQLYCVEKDSSASIFSDRVGLVDFDGARWLLGKNVTQREVGNTSELMLNTVDFQRGAPRGERPESGRHARRRGRPVRRRPARALVDPRDVHRKPDSRRRWRRQAGQGILPRRRRPERRPAHALDPARRRPGRHRVELPLRRRRGNAAGSGVRHSLDERYARCVDTHRQIQRWCVDCTGATLSYWFSYTLHPHQIAAALGCVDGINGQDALCADVATAHDAECP
jgi:hypothetical protein